MLRFFKRITAVMVVAFIILSSFSLNGVGYIGFKVDAASFIEPIIVEDFAEIELQSDGGIAPYSNVTYSGCYGNQLSGNSKEIYDAFVDFYAEDRNCQEFDGELDVDYNFTASVSGDSIVKDEAYNNIVEEIRVDFNGAMSAFLYDYPEVYWFRGMSMGYSVNPYGYVVSNTVECKITEFSFSPQEIYSGVTSKISAFDSAVENVYSQIASNVTSITSRKDILKLIHDYICEESYYSYSGAYVDLKVHSPEPVFIGDGGIVCEGYAKSFKILCDKFGIPCALISGDGANGKVNEPHMWNYVQMDDSKWYLVDVTWDDQELGMLYDYFIAHSSAPGFNLTVGEEHIENGDFEGSGLNYFTYPALSNTQYALCSHNWSDATCTTPQTCSKCSATQGVELGHKYDNDCDTSCNICGVTRTVSAHSYNSGVVTKKATCKETGVMTYTCTVCGAPKTETIAKSTTHTYSNATCTKAKTCKVCGLTNGNALGHAYNLGEVTEKATCKATGTKTYTCLVCAVTKTETISKSNTHTYSNDCDKACNVCGVTRTVPAHKYTNTCDTKCDVCDASRTIKHTYTNKCDTSCNVCKAKRTITHSYKTTTTKAKISSNGKIVKKCTVCGNVASTTTIKRIKTIKLATTSYTYNGKVKTPTVVVKDSAGKTLKKNTDYTVKYLTNRKSIGTHKVKITFVGKYSGSKTLTFAISLAKSSVSKLTAGKKSLTVSLKKTSNVSGYQIEYSTSKKFTNAKTKTTTSTKATIKGLSAKKTYYVRVRTYKTVNGKKYYSAWSTIKYKKTK